MKIKAIKDGIVKEFSKIEWSYMPPNKFGYVVLTEIPTPSEVLEKPIEVNETTKKEAEIKGTPKPKGRPKSK